MSLELIQQQAVQTYNENIAYFKQHHPELYQNLLVFETALNEKHIQAKFDLQYKENYFEIIGLEQNLPFYGQNSMNISQSMVNERVDFVASSNSFKCFYETNYTDQIAHEALDMSILSPAKLGNAPLVHYVNKRLPKKEIMKDIFKYIIFGVGLGLHIPMIHQKIKAKVYLIVEPNLELFRLSLFTTNYVQLAKESKLLFSVAHNELKFREIFRTFYSEVFVLNHYFKFFKLSDSCDFYIKTIQNVLVSQGHYLYSYNRTFLSILRTHSYISQGYKTLNISTIQNLALFTKPVLYLAAGPSLQHQIEFVKNNQEKFIIVAIYATLPLLEEHNIKPDIVTQYDEQDKPVLNTLNRVKNISFFDKTIFIFGSHVNAKLMGTFKKENIFIFQAMFELKKEFGTLTSPSIGELTYGILLKLGAKEIYMLGLDLAMDSQSNQTHIEGHSGSKAFQELKELEDSDDKNYSYRKNTILVQGNFLKEVKSVPVFKSNIDAFNTMTQQYKSKDCNVYNLSNGAYFHDTIPTKADNIKVLSFEKIQKETLPQIIYESLESISDVGYTKEELELIQLKISGAKKLKKTLEQFIKIKKHKTFTEYKDRLILTLNNILLEKQSCPDLQSILINYSSHTLHHIFHLFNIQEDDINKKSIYDINKLINIQFNKIINTYVIAISYEKEETSISKKMNKFIKEYSIKDTIYSEPFFQELVETSLPGKQHESGKNSIGFFATEENLTNKTFISYIKNIVKLYPDVKLRAYYFYEYQKVLAQHTLKEIKNNIDIILPNSIQHIAKNVEIWIETSQKTMSLQKTNDIILNNYQNIYSVMFEDKEEILKTPQMMSNKLKETIQKTLPTTIYYEFANSLKRQFNKEKLCSLHKKESLGFFAFQENLTKEFIQNILDIYNQFPQLKFVIFYFNEKQKQQFKLQFNNLLSRFSFVIPHTIYDIAQNVEIWAQAETKNQSYLFHIINYQLNQTEKVFPIIISKELKIMESSTYPSTLIKDYKETKFVKQLFNLKYNHNLTSNLNKDYFSFFATEENLNDKEFVKLLLILVELFPEVNYKVFYFTEIQKHLFQTIFFENTTNFILTEVETFENIINDISTFLYSSLNTANKNYNVTQEFLLHIQTKRIKLFTIELFKKIHLKDYLSSINLRINQNSEFKSSHVSKLFLNSNVYKEYCFQADLSNTINNNLYSRNSLGFIVSKENLLNQLFLKHIENLSIQYSDIIIKGFYFHEEDISKAKKSLNLPQVQFFKIDNINDISSEIEIFIGNGESLIDQDINNHLLENNLNIFSCSYIPKYDKVSSSKFNYSSSPIIISPEEFSLTDSELFELNYDANKSLHFSICKQSGIPYEKLPDNITINDIWNKIILKNTLISIEYKICLNKSIQKIANFNIEKS